MSTNIDNLRRIVLPGYTAISVTGADRTEFLQGQLTQDLSEISADFSALGGWTTAKGRLLAISPLIAWREAVHLLLPEEIAEPVARRLRMFVLRARVEVLTGEFAVAGLTGAADQTLTAGEISLPGA